MIQVRNVPDTLHRRLKVRAALAGLSLSEYVLQEMKLAEKRSTYDEFPARLRLRTQVHTRETAAQAVRAEREGRRR